eukprot:scaffold69502_cov67-Phaeocystis_antarctica.AAC.6
MPREASRSASIACTLATAASRPAAASAAAGWTGRGTPTQAQPAPVGASGKTNSTQGMRILLTPSLSRPRHVLPVSPAPCSQITQAVTFTWRSQCISAGVSVSVVKSTCMAPAPAAHPVVHPHRDDAARVGEAPDGDEELEAILLRLVVVLVAEQVLAYLLLVGVRVVDHLSLEARPVLKTRPVRPACQPEQTGRGWPRLEAEAGGRPELDLALAGRAGGRIGRRLWVAVFHIERDLGGVIPLTFRCHLSKSFSAWSPISFAGLRYFNSCGVRAVRVRYACGARAVRRCVCKASKARAVRVQSVRCKAARVRLSLALTLTCSSSALQSSWTSSFIVLHEVWPGGRAWLGSGSGLRLGSGLGSVVRGRGSGLAGRGAPSRAEI